MLGLGSSGAGAQSLAANLNVPAAVRALDVDQGSRALGAVATQASLTSAVLSTQPQPAQTVRTSLPQSIAQEAAWLYKGGWPLYALVDKYSTGQALNDEANCIATAVYFEARGESLEGQLAVAEVVLNRARSGRYPATWCGVVTQHAQFSFVRGGVIPAANRSSEAWKRAVAIARIAQQGSNRLLAPNVLWYHANYVSPSWGRRLARSSVIGAHIFYR